MMKGPHGPRMGRGPGAKNPGRTMKRILGEVMSRYALHYALVLLCIVISSVATVRGTLFTQKLIDDYNSSAPAYKRVYRLKTRDTEFPKTPSKKIKRY